MSFVPFLVCEMIIVIESIPYTRDYTNGYLAYVLLAPVIGGLFALYFVGKWWFDYFYGKYISKIEKLMEEIKC